MADCREVGKAMQKVQPKPNSYMDWKPTVGLSIRNYLQIRMTTPSDRSIKSWVRLGSAYCSKLGF